MAQSKLQKLGKEEVERRLKAKRKFRLKRNIKSGSGKMLLLASLCLNVYYLSLPYHEEILTNIIEIYQKVAPVVENLINQLPL